MIGKYKQYAKIVASLAIITLFMGTASAMVAEETLPTLYIDCGGPYSMGMGNDLTLNPTVTITDLPDEWTGIATEYGDVWATVFFEWDFDNDGFYDDASAGPLDQMMTGSTTTMTFHGTGDTDYFASHETGVYNVACRAHIEINGGSYYDPEENVEGMYIEFRDSLSCSATVEVLNPIVADAGGPYSGMEDSPITFDGTGSYDTREIRAATAIEPTMVASTGIKSYEWDFDEDGEFDDASGSNPEYTFTEPGTYKISIKVTSWDGYTDFDGASVEIEAVNPLVIDIGGPYTGIAGSSITLDATGSYDQRQLLEPTSASIFMVAKASPQVGIEYYLWDLNNDGTFGDAQGSVIQHTFATAGSYPIGLKVISYDGFEKTDCTTVRITRPSDNQIPEFPTIALPIAAIIGLAFIMQRRKD